MAVRILKAGASTEADNDPANYTVLAGKDRLLVCLSGIEGVGDTMDTLTYGTVSMTLIDATAEWEGKTLYAWVLDEAGIVAASTNVFLGGYSGSPSSNRMSHYVILLQGASQTLTTEFGESVADTSNPVEVVLSGENLSIGIAIARVNNASTAWTWDNAWTKDQDTTTLLGFNDTSAAYKLFAGSGSQTAAANGGGSDSKGLLAVRFSASVGANETRVADAVGQLTATTATNDIVVPGEGRTPTGCVVYCTYGTGLDANIDDAQISIGYSDFTNQYAGSANAEDTQADTDSAAESHDGVVLAVMTPGTHAVIRSATVTAISGGIQLTPVQSGAQYRVMAILIFEAECVAMSTGDGTRTEDVEFDFAHTLAGEPNFGWVSHVNTDFGVGSNSARLSMGFFSNESDTIIVRVMGHNFEHNVPAGESHAQLSTNRIVAIVNFTSGGISIGGELTGIDATNFSMTPRNNPFQSPVLGLLVYASDVTAEVVSVDSPTTAGSDWNYNGASITAQHLTLAMSMIQDENTAKTDTAEAGGYGIYVTDGSDDFSAVMCNQNGADPTNTKSRVSTDLHLLTDGGTDAFEMTNFVFTSDGWDVANANIATADGTIRKWFALLISEASTSSVVITDVNTTETWNDGDTGLVITGTGFV